MIHIYNSGDWIFHLMSPQYGNSGLELKCAHCFPKQQFGQNLTGSVGIFPSLRKTINESSELFA